MKMDVEIKGMYLNEENHEAAKESTAKILQAYSEKLRKMKEEESDG
ncbi:MAG: hypothetical protein IJM27_03650 [Eubacterium sp.]|nr:hypothetical protein [Eubacterium sp.]